MRNVHATKKYKAAVAKWSTRMAELVTLIGQCQRSATWHTHAIMTNGGELGISVDSMFGSIMCRFAEPERAKQYAWINPYSGKWNHHGDCPASSFLLFARNAKCYGMLSPEHTEKLEPYIALAEKEIVSK